MTSPNKTAPKNMRVLVTGATGFIGMSLVPLLRKEGYLVRTANHIIDKKDAGTKSIQNENVYFDLDVDENNYDQLLAGVDIVVHLAARVHILSDKGKNNDQIYKRTNTLGTENLAKESVKRGIKRFIYLSSIKVNGESNITRKNNEYCPFKEDDIPRPNSAYAISKLEAEDVIRNICSKSAMDFVILRLPLIYGPGVKANFLSLINIINKNIPLPLGRIRNQRSLLYIGNLSHAISLCIKHPDVRNKTYLISDIDISIQDLVRKIGLLLGKKVVLFPFPVSSLKIMGSLVNKRSMIDRLTDSLIVDNSSMRNDMDWIPPYSFDEGMKTTIDWYLDKKISDTHNDINKRP